MSDNIINFQQRRQLEQAIAAFADAPNEQALAEAARRVVHEFPESAVLAALLKHLETPDSQIRGGLGHMAALLPSETILHALRTFAADRRHHPLARMTAMTIAGRFLGTELPTALVEDLRHADDAAFQSLQEAIREGKRNRHVLLEYVEQMSELGEEIAFLVIQALERILPPDRVELLRLIAQDRRAAVANAAVRALEGLLGGEAEALALRALHTLQAVLPPEQASGVERTLRKARMAGRGYAPPTPEDWRALISPAESNGAQTVWLVQLPAAPAPYGTLLGFSLNLDVGMLRFFGSEAVDRAVLPPAKTIGELQTVADDRGARAVLLEAPFAYGCWLVLRAVQAQRRAHPDQPLPSEFRLYHDGFTQFASPTVEPAIQHIWQREVEPAELAEVDLEAATSALFVHPAMAGWTVASRAIWQATPAAARPDPSLPLTEVVRALLREVGRWPESAALTSALVRSLRGQAAWLHLAGESNLAEHALTLATALPHLAIDQNPVLAQMLAKSLQQQPGQ